MALFGRETPRDAQRVEAYRQWFTRQHPLALASAVLSIFSLTHFGTLFIDELLGIALGIIAIKQSRAQLPSQPLQTSASSVEPRRAVTFAYIGIVIGIISLICAIVIYSLPAATN